MLKNLTLTLIKQTSRNNEESYVYKLGKHIVFYGWKVDPKRNRFDSLNYKDNEFVYKLIVPQDDLTNGKISGLTHKRYTELTFSTFEELENYIYEERT